MGRGRFFGSSAFSAHTRPDLLEASCGSPAGRRSVMNSSAADARVLPASALEQNACSKSAATATKARASPKAKASTRPASRRSTKPASPQIDEQDLLNAVESLYRDQLKPYGRLLRKRLNERGVALGLESGESGLMHLRSECEKSSWLTLEAAQGGEWVAMLVGCKPDFVDVYSPVDCYPESLWTAAAEYLESVSGVEAVLPSGRFSCAQSLMERRLPFLHGYSLGALCHIVQLMISQKKLLGYCNEGICPYARSQSMLKEKAAKQKSCEEASDLPLATWPVVRRSMLETLQENGSPIPVPLSNIKRLFRTQYQTELCETALGHSKLSELLQDPHLDGICTVGLLEQGYFVIPLFDKVPCSEDETEVGSESQSGSEPMLCLSSSHWTVRNTFIEVPAAREVLRRCKSLGELEVTSLFLEPREQVQVVCQSLPANLEALGFAVHNTFIGEHSQLDGDCHRRSRSVPKA